ncbi:5-carboxymethyl-2-hydroxymuconate Delta-isomerase [Shewanella chilikensis]|uniref:5-carboxymethyl-2-hydroxymuconate Delta-isomerase n=1 Tax=Shewanella chilikensis TaxID=558541 RepID=UPI001F40D57C|nr:5-carboxymethyl-2-hydroxymuconate Delta-isomerase [Shewanella chilikensis]MCE9789951.1 5-carboxymethyl-2-hydroxymuconate Delta-isomerase [Shewanella chilikensis]
MPHCIIEYSAPLAQQLSIAKLVQAVHQGAIDSGLFTPSAIKSRAHACEHFLVGEDSAQSFIHVRLAIMPGRTDEQKQALTRSVFAALEPIAAKADSVSLEVTELHQPSYLKRGS